jgi:hypothetical protein
MKIKMFCEAISRKLDERERGIASLMHEAYVNNCPMEYMKAAMKWDHEYAPMTTNANQLREIGIYLPHVSNMSDDEVGKNLEIVIEGLKFLGIHIIGTDGMQQRELYTILAERILQEPTRDIPPNNDMKEYIDFTKSNMHSFSKA